MVDLDKELRQKPPRTRISASKLAWSVSSRHRSAEADKTPKSRDRLPIDPLSMLFAVNQNPRSGPEAISHALENSAKGMILWTQEDRISELGRGAEDAYPTSLGYVCCGSRR